MTNNPIVDAIVDGVNVDKALVRSSILKLALVLDSVAELRAMDTSGQKQVFIPPSSFFRYDATDTVTADDGVNCIIDAAGRRYKLIPTSGGGGSSSGIAMQTSIAGTANQLNITASGMGALSATPQAILFKPSSNNTAAAQASFDGGTTNIPIQKANGGSIGADDLVAGVWVLGFATTTKLELALFGAT